MGQGDEAGKTDMRVRRTFAVDTPKGIDQVISDNPTYVSFEINHKNGRNFKIIGKAIAPVFKKIFRWGGGLECLLVFVHFDT